jgi:eukaryotic-like serine/threonine-protein kinase
VRRLAKVRAFTTELDECRAREAEQRRALEALDGRERDGRQRLGDAMDSLGVDASQARDDARVAIAAAEQSTVVVAAHVDRYRELQRAILQWEGRSGLSEPSARLASAYRAAADEIDVWLTDRNCEMQCRAEATRCENLVNDIDYQIRELRTALARLEQSVEQERADAQAALKEHGRRAEELETKLLQLAAELCAPLRSMPATGPLFRQLEHEL